MSEKMYRVLLLVSRYFEVRSRHLLRFSSNESGAAHLAIVLLLLLGLAVGTYVVQNPTRFIPHADCNPGIDNECDDYSEGEYTEKQREDDYEKSEQQDLERGAKEAGKSLDEYKVDDCKANPGKSECADVLKKEQQKKDGNSNKGSNDTKSQDDQSHDSSNPNDLCRDKGSEQARKDCELEKKSDAGCGDQKTYCHNGKKIYKHGGYWDQNEDNGKGGCVYDYADTGVSCDSGSKDGSLSNQDNDKFSKVFDKSKHCDEVTYCDDRGGTPKAFRKFAVGVDKNGDCEYEIKEDSSKSCAGKKSGDVVAQGSGKRLSTDPKTNLTPDDIIIRNEKAAAVSKSDLDSAKQKLKEKGLEFDTINKTADENIKSCQDKGKTEAECKIFFESFKGLEDAQKLYDEAIKSDCSSLTDTAKKAQCEALKRAAFDNAKFRARSAMCDAVENNVQGANCVPDLGDTQNIIKVSIHGNEERVFIGCSTQKVDADGRCQKILNYRDPKDGQIKPVPPEALTALGLDPNVEIYSMSQLPEGMQKSIDYACQTASIACIAAGTNSSNQSASSAPAGELGSSQPSQSCKDPEIRNKYTQHHLSKSCASCLQTKYQTAHGGKSIADKLRGDLTSRSSGCSDNDLLNYYASSNYGGNEFKIRTEGQAGNDECKSECGSNTFSTTSTTASSPPAQSASTGTNTRVAKASASGVHLSTDQKAALENGDRIEYTSDQRQKIIDKTIQDNPSLNGTDLGIAVGKALNDAGSTVEQATGAAGEIAKQKGGDPADAATAVATTGYTSNSDKNQKIAGTAFESAFADSTQTDLKKKCSEASTKAIASAKKRGVTITSTDFKDSISYKRNCQP